MPGSLYKEKTLDVENKSCSCRVGILVHSVEHAVFFVATASLIRSPAALTSETCQESSRKDLQLLCPNNFVELAAFVCLFLWLTMRFLCH